ncbi:SlyX protein [Alkalilimnicola ehrlichii]|uniref:Protein SlyX homolog n=1 Tax=Alkalilimnicola ehrlichii TaxID=351052 RepID=A0A3E0X1E3_9GAMM|nr:SlyX family protein [Alkalilimnicola ehrlichii]RFA31250.1 SlyX protein [Alkalilimnicola ehrlichii]RFA39473.1 SlyX protein [Alkalilimnicola ehrlichii]
MDDRLVDLETRIAFQEQGIQDLEAVILRQQKEIEALTRRLEAAEQRLRAVTPSNLADLSEETPPPHY